MTKLYYETYGKGQPLVMVHGWAMHSGIWRDFAQQLAKRYQVICVDLPNHGRSRVGEMPFTLENISQTLAQTLPEQPCCYLGWSLGATVVLDFARRYSERVNSLILLAGNPLFVGSSHWAGVEPKVLDNFATSLTVDCQMMLLRFLALQVNNLPNAKALLKQLKANVLACEPPDTQTLQAGLDILKHTDLTKFLAQLNKPVSIILGDKDTLVPIAVAEQLKQLRLTYPTEITILHDAGHVPFLSHSSQLLQIICQFMDKQWH